MPRGVPNVKVDAPAEPAAKVAIEAEPEAEPEITGRFETFEAVRPNGDIAVVTRNIDTGEQSVIDK